MSSLYTEVQAWPSGKDVAWSRDMGKVEFMKLIDNVKTDDRYRVVRIAEATGHLVVRLPPYHCQLDPIELVWSDVKGFAASENWFGKVSCQ